MAMFYHVRLRSRMHALKPYGADLELDEYMEFMKFGGMLCGARS
jgi:hypothetical protein